jgi:aminoglycoside N3'-acetyltransferase
MQTVMVSQSDIQATIRQLGLTGEPVCVHSSLRSFGHVTGGAAAVVQSFLEEGCTLVVPTYSYSFAAAPPEQQVQRNGWNYDQYTGSNSGRNKIYTPATQAIDDDMGAIPAAVLNTPQRIRGDHPLNSFSAVGPRAEPLIAGQGALAVYAPLQALVEASGYVLLTGVALDKMTLLHLAEQQAGRVPFRRWANDRQGRPQMVEAGSCSDGFEHFANLLQPWRQARRVGESQWQLFPAQQALQAATAAIRANPQITHCGRLDCERCRDAVLGGPILT